MAIAVIISGEKKPNSEVNPIAGFVGLLAVICLITGMILGITGIRISDAAGKRVTFSGVSPDFSDGVLDFREERKQEKEVAVVEEDWEEVEED